MGRSGKLFAYEWAGIEPDVMALAKGLGGGFPIGAILATEQAATGMVPGIHGTTFGGNPLAMAVANAVLDVMLEPDFLPHVERTGRLLRGKLEALAARFPHVIAERSEEHTSELQSLMRISSAVFCLKKKNKQN